MKNNFKKKCDEIFENQIKRKSTKEKISIIQNIIGKNIPEEYQYILENYSGVFLKDNYEICSKYKSPMTDEEGVEPFLYFIGIDGADNFFSVYEMYKEQLPHNYFPIALADGGNLICINGNTDYVYMWIHDDLQNVAYKIFDSFEEMIMMVKKIDYKDEDLGVISANVVFSEEFQEALKAMKESK